MMPNGSGALPLAMTMAFTAVTAASTGSGQRRRAAIGAQNTNARIRRWPRSCGYGPPVRASVIRAAHRVSMAPASHWDTPRAAGLRGGVPGPRGGAAGLRGGAAAGRCLATALTVTSGTGERIVLENDDTDEGALCGPQVVKPQVARFMIVG